MESEAHRSPSQCSRALELFLYFFKIGFYTFGGGWSIVAQIQQEYVQKKGWITDEDLLDITSVGRSLPGLMIGNVSYLFGYHVAGFPGALACLLGISLPSLIVLTVVTWCYTQVKDNLVRQPGHDRRPGRRSACGGLRSVEAAEGGVDRPGRVCLSFSGLRPVPVRRTELHPHRTHQRIFRLAAVRLALPEGRPLMILLELFWSFCKIGFTSFGGLSMVPLINSEMLSHGWMTLSEVSDIVAIAEITPGPLGLNCATFAGTRVAGLAGAVSASLGVLSPTLLICAAAAVMFEKFRESDFMKKVMYGIRPACLGLIIAVVCSLTTTNYTNAAGSISCGAALIGVAATVLLLKFKVSIPKVILLSAVLGLFLTR